MPKAFAIIGNVIPNAFNSFVLKESLRYNAVVCSTGIIMRTVISAAVRIGCRRVPDISKARKVLWFNPRVGLEEGILMMLDQPEIIETWSDPIERA